VPATFAATNDKRKTLAFAFDHLALHAPVPRTMIALEPARRSERLRSTRTRARCASPVLVPAPRRRCSNDAESPKLRFIESNCVQCGNLRGDLSRARDHTGAAARLERRGASAARPERGEGVRLHPVRQADGDRKLVMAMFERLRTHSMFADEIVTGAQDVRDCRVVDLMTHEKTIDIRNI